MSITKKIQRRTTGRWSTAEHPGRRSRPTFTVDELRGIVADCDQAGLPGNTPLWTEIDNYVLHGFSLDFTELIADEVVANTEEN